ncbi:terminase small subunit [Lysinibacillus sp. fls2-241-R2A-57]|uniref:terminase small subunit n=1 Tax=Lysinibacillus sp. fls2-241-R2A-57 TaxID=3040292 RepID=UPI002557849B|nr:terminase small subunit [Lysinibacillus sp. fls2-241-R2A-57]
MGKVKKLTPKQQAFADYYIELGNATEAYIKAGYNERGSRANSARSIANDSVKAYIENRMEELKIKKIEAVSPNLFLLTHSCTHAHHFISPIQPHISPN